MAKDLCRVKYDGTHYIACKYSNMSPFLEADEIVNLSAEDLKIKSKKELFINAYAEEKFGISSKKRFGKFISQLDIILLELYEKYNKNNMLEKELINLIYEGLKEKCDCIIYKNLGGKLEELIYTFECNSIIKIIEKIKDSKITQCEKTVILIKDFVKKQKNNLRKRHQNFYDRAVSNEWSYFTTFTYDNVIFYEKLTGKKWKKNKNRTYNRKWIDGLKWVEENKELVESTFKKQLLKKLQNLHSNKSWLYMGVWENGSESGRLHFHCFIFIPSGSDVGTFRQVKEYNSFIKENVEININTDFEKKFGRNDFSRIVDQQDALFIKEVNYMLKYITKQSDKVVYSRGLKDKILVVGDFDNNKIIRLKEDNPYFIMSSTFMDEIIYVDKNYDVIE